VPSSTSFLKRNSEVIKSSVLAVFKKPTELSTHVNPAVDGIGKSASPTKQEKVPSGSSVESTVVKTHVGQRSKSVFVPSSVNAIATAVVTPVMTVEEPTEVLDEGHLEELVATEDDNTTAGKWMVAKFPYTATDSEGVTLKEQDYFYVTNTEDKDWYYGTTEDGSVTGFFPSSYLADVDA
jgi:hypothetical protein